MSDELPPGWSTAPLGYVADLQLGKMLDKAKNLAGEPLPYLRNVNVRWGSFDLGDLLTMRFTKTEAEKFLIRDGDLLVCEGGEPGRCAVWRGGPTQIRFQKALHRVRPHRALLPDWVALFLRHSAETGSLDDHFTGTTIKHLPGQALAALTIPLPPVAEQRRIVERIEALFARTGRARTDLLRIAPLAKLYRDRILAESFEDDWPESTIADLADTTFDGPFGSNLKSSDYTSEGTRVVRLENIGHLRFIGDKETFISPEKGEALARHTLLTDDVLFSSFVDKEVRVCRLPPSLSGAAINKADCFCIRVDREKALPAFVEKRLASPSTYEDMRDAVHGATRPRIGLSDLRSYRVGVPDLDAQTAIVAAIDTAHASSEVAEREATRALALLDHLEQSILTRAFRGNLVPQDPTDEPAATLLERIRHGQETGSGTTAPKRRGRPPKVTSSRTDTKESGMAKTRADVPADHLREQLKGMGGKAKAKELWQQSGMDLDEFYKLLRDDVRAGHIREGKDKDHLVLSHAA